MLPFFLGVTGIDKRRNKHITGTAYARRLGAKLRESGLRSFVHVQRSHEYHIVIEKIMLRIDGRKEKEGYTKEGGTRM